ncbi:MAG: hypothetical protein QNJ38_01290 [Prochloraceae cyanobacterium]|nr:hypothetical protein [Prochloraceae cyanobacterium]
MPSKRPNRKVFTIRTDEKTPELLKQQAFQKGYVYGNQGATGDYLDAIASEKYIVIEKEIWQSVLQLCEKVSIMKMSEAKKPPTNLDNQKGGESLG